MRVVSKFLAVIVMFLLSARFFYIVAAAVNLGIISDSSSDEYRANDNRGGAYGQTTFSWDELLVKYRGVNLGSWGTRSEPRRSGYEYNWARSGAEAATLLSSGQHTGVAAQIQSGLVNLVYFQIGNNDFAYYRQGADIYNGTLAGAALDTKINNYIADVRTALTTVLASSPNIKIILGTTADPGQAPTWAAQFPDPVKRKRLADAVEKANEGIRALAVGKPNVLLFESDSIATVILSKLDSQGNIVIQGEKISAVAPGDEPHHLVLGDGIHGGTVAEALYANAVIPYINQALNVNIQSFSDSEMLVMSGIKQSSAVQGDANNDGHVNGADYIIWLNHYGLAGSGNSSGDFNADGQVNGTDYILWLKNYGM